MIGNSSNKAHSRVRPLCVDRLSFDIKMMDERLKVIGKRTVYPSDRGMVGKGSYLDKLLEYAPQDYVCGYIMRNAWNKNLWGIFLVMGYIQRRE